MLPDMEFITIGISSFAGAFFAFLTERLARYRDAALHEEAAINNLILDLAAKRAFLTQNDWTWAEGEVERVKGSVTHARILIRDTRAALQPRSKALAHLLQMNRSCNAFLERSERRNDDEEVKVALKVLTESLRDEVRELHSLRPTRIAADAPGSIAL